MLLDPRDICQRFMPKELFAGAANKVRDRNQNQDAERGHCELGSYDEQSGIEFWHRAKTPSVSITNPTVSSTQQLGDGRDPSRVIARAFPALSDFWPSPNVLSSLGVNRGRADKLGALLASGRLGGVLR
jgi:hypothetical protein